MPARRPAGRDDRDGAHHATVDPATQGTLTNSAAATTPDESDPQDNVAQADTEVVAAADVSVIKTVTGATGRRRFRSAGAVVVSNAGPAAAPDVVLTDALPAGLGDPVLPDGCTLDRGHRRLRDR